jgi:putative transposase
MSIITFQYRIKDSIAGKHLLKMAHAVNRVWNYCNEVSMFALKRDHRDLSAYDLHNLTAHTASELGLHAHTIQKVCTEYATRRKQYRKRRLAWRSKRRSLGWIPFKANGIRLAGDSVVYRGMPFRLWLSRPIEGTIREGSFTQDTRGRWYVNLQCEVVDRAQPLGDQELGLDFGLTEQIACSDGVLYSRVHLTQCYAEALALAQRAKKKRRVQALHAKIKNVRNDWTHKVTTTIVRRARLVVIGDVSSAKLVKTRFAKSVYDAAWGTTRVHLHYKAIRLGALCVPGSEMFSSVTCSVCLQRTGPSGLSGLGVREWRCSACGVWHHRDINAARNILRAGRCTPIKGIPVL